ncbi:ShlB/FhaC/HecB family hemolysin secretion/activation protein [Shewanella chilikensis]|uniref:ShlB/FhaC/HecB family hemolysin secretion/activation protein n=1 Tax=Shewanella chilikensis TaxID=558541 RepID=UPI0030058933
MATSRSVLLLATLFASLSVLAETGTAGDGITSSSQGQNPLSERFKVGKIVVVSNPIFDESAKNAIFLHNWANALHINTRESVILNRLSIQEGQEVTPRQLEEAQRILRREPYLRDARISVVKADPSADQQPDGETLLVETWDQWSLLPTISLGRSGGNNSFSVGLKDDNILGLGIRTRLKYQSDEDRTGYKVAFEMPLNIIKNATVAANFYDNSDGQAKQLYFDKPFYTLDDTRAYGAEYLDEDRIDTIRQNGLDINEFDEEIRYRNLYWGFMFAKENQSRQRLRLGVTQDKHSFYALPQYPQQPLPQDRDFLYPWVEWEYLQDDFRVLTNIHLVNYNEDFNLGWHHSVKLGLETKDSDSLGYHLNWRSSRGYFEGKELLLLAFGGEATLATRQRDFYQVNVAAEYFYKFTPKWTAYSKVRLSNSNNNYIDRPFALGDETGIRGYPNDYQHGDNQWLLTGEIRYYPNINLYQLAELGWAAFIDVGQALGGAMANDNEVSGPIGSVGIGARVYSSRSSYGHVAHIDFSVPFTRGDEVDGWEWRFQVKQSF